MKIFIIMLFALSLTANARIGETYQQLVVRYGSPIVPLSDKGVVDFAFNGMSIRAVIRNGICAMESYTTKEEMTEDERAIILTANEGGNVWIFSDPDAHTIYQWKRKDARAYGLQMDRHTLAIFSNTEYEWFLSTMPSQKNGPLKGL